MAQLRLVYQRTDSGVTAPAFMEQTLQHIDERYGGIDAYVRAIGLQSEQIGRLQRRLLV